MISQSKKGILYQIRKVPGLDAIDEALGRCVETGRPVMSTPSYRPLVSSMALPIMAGIAMTRYTCLKAAELDLPILIPVGSADTLPLLMKNYEEACIEAGKPEAYNPDNVYYMSGEQFAFASGLLQLLIDKKPGACIWIGRWSAETLSATTVGAKIGAFQIGGTDQFSNTSFFAITTDYTLVGDELYAAAAYVSKDPELSMTLSAQDVIKILAAVIIIVGVIVQTLGFDIISKLLFM